MCAVTSGNFHQNQYTVCIENDGKLGMCFGICIGGSRDVEYNFLHIVERKIWRLSIYTSTSSMYASKNSAEFFANADFWVPVVN